MRVVLVDLDVKSDPIRCHLVCGLTFVVLSVQEMGIAGDVDDISNEFDRRSLHVRR